MTFNEYQEQSKETVMEGLDRIEYYAIGLGDEAGEVLGKVKKLWRDRDFVIDDEFRDMLKGELGDVLWYLAQLGRVSGIRLDDIAAYNIEKTHSRKKRDVLHGDGDNR